MRGSRHRRKQDMQEKLRRLRHKMVWNVIEAVIALVIAAALIICVL